VTAFEVLTLVVAVVSLGLVVLQVRIAAKTLQSDHTRRKQQATLEYLIHDVRPHWKDELRTVVRRFGDAVPMPEAAMDALRSDPEANRLVIKLLGNIEHMAVGVNMDVYDIGVIDRASGAFLIRVYRQFLPYIKRAQSRQQSAYEEFDRLVVELCRRRNRPVPTSTEPAPTSAA
jgi:hypothetical protein